MPSIVSVERSLFSPTKATESSFLWLNFSKASSRYNFTDKASKFSTNRCHCY